MSRPALAYVAMLVIGAAWNVIEGSRAAQSLKLSRLHRTLAALVAFLTVPALLVWVAAHVEETARAVHIIHPLLAMVALLALLLAMTAAVTRRTHWLVALPVAAWNAVVLCTASVTIAGARTALPWELQAVTVAHASALAHWLGPITLVGAWLAPMPLVIGAASDAGAMRRAAHYVLAVCAAAVVTVVALAYPPALEATASYAPFGATRLESPSASPFVTALSILPEVRAVPSATALRADLELADTLGVGALFVRVAKGGGTAAALDSLQRALEPARRDSTLLMVSIAPAERDVEAVMRRLRPDYLVLRDVRTVADAREAATLAHRLRPATHVALLVRGDNSSDAAMVTDAGGFGIDAVLLSLTPSVRGARSDADGLAALDGWMARATLPREYWVLAEGAPLTFGESAQRRLLHHVLAWAAARAGVRGVVVAQAGDYDRVTGLRAANGRWRPAVADLQQLILSLSEPFISPTP